MPIRPGRPRLAIAGIALALFAAAADGGAVPEPPAMTPVDVADDRIDPAARAALVRLSAGGPDLAAEAWLLLKAVRSRALGGIRVESGETALYRARALGIDRDALLGEGRVARCVVRPQGARPLLVYADAAAEDPSALDAALLAGFRACPFARLEVVVTRGSDAVGGAVVIAESAALGIRTDPCRTTPAGRCRFALPHGAELAVRVRGDGREAARSVALAPEGGVLRIDLADPAAAPGPPGA